MCEVHFQYMGYCILYGNLCQAVSREIKFIYEDGSPVPSAVRKGDVDGNGVIDVRDVRRILDHIYEIAFIE